MRTISLCLGAEDFAYLLAVEMIDHRRRAQLCRLIFLRGLACAPIKRSKPSACIHLQIRLPVEVYSQLMPDDDPRSIFAAGVRDYARGKRLAFAKLRRIHVPARGVEVKG